MGGPARTGDAAADHNKADHVRVSFSKLLSLSPPHGRLSAASVSFPSRGPSPPFLLLQPNRLLILLIPFLLLPASCFLFPAYFASTSVSSSSSSRCFLHIVHVRVFVLVFAPNFLVLQKCSPDSAAVLRRLYGSILPHSTCNMAELLAILLRLLNKFCYALGVPKSRRMRPAKWRTYLSKRRIPAAYWPLHLHKRRCASWSMGHFVSCGSRRCGIIPSSIHHTIGHKIQLQVRL